MEDALKNLVAERNKAKTEINSRSQEHYTAVGPAWGWAQNTPYKRYKSWCFEGGIKTPLNRLVAQEDSSEPND